MSLSEVRYERRVDIHTNEDRTISTLLKGDIPGFSAEQVRIVQLQREASLGNHWREYVEVYGVVGKAKIVLEEVTTKKRSEYNLLTGDRLFVPAEVALRIDAKKETVIIACGAETDREGKTHKYIVA